uniref:Ubiquitin carboxyl-terminal hydrolase n=1 Tax=Strigamia maritima TaxID=126957 RepID=T1IWW7_STRMM
SQEIPQNEHYFGRNNQIGLPRYREEDINRAYISHKLRPCRLPKYFGADYTTDHDEIGPTKNKECLQEFLSDSLLTNLLLSDAYLHRSPIHNLVFRSLELLKDTQRGLELFQLISRHSVLLASRTHSLKELQEIALILLSWPICIPQDVDSRIQLATIIVKGTACVEIELANSRPILFEINLISQLFKHLLSNLDQNNIMVVLREVYRLISDPSIEPSWALSSIVQYLPMTVSPEVVSTVMTDISIGNDILYLSLKRMMNWLLLSSDPDNIANWIMTLLRGLALGSKFHVLSRLTEDSVEQVFEYLNVAESKNAAFLVLSHMLLSYQHSPDVFHKIVRFIPQKIVAWKAATPPDMENDFLNQFVLLVNIMLYKHNGFPDLYDPILAVLDTFPKPNPDIMNKMLKEHKWANSQATYSSLHYNCSPRSDTGKTGLINMGNTCYMNSIIQTLYMTDEFRDAVILQTPSKYEIVLTHLQWLFAFLTHTQRTALNASEFYKASRPPWFESGNQQDCSEYLRHLLDILHEQETSVHSNSDAASPSGKRECATSSSVNGLPRSSFRNRPSSPSSVSSSSSASSSSSPLRKQSPSKRSKATKRKNSSLDIDKLTECSSMCEPIGNGTFVQHSTAQKSLVHKAFAGKLVTSYKCFSCHKISESAENFIDLHLAFPSNARHSRATRYQIRQASKHALATCTPSSTDVEMTNLDVTSPKSENNNPLCLEDLIEYYLTPELLEKENRYFCSSCNALSDAERSIRIVETPQYLILTLLRFSFDSGTRSRSKILTDVAYPLKLHLPVCRNHERDGDDSMPPNKQRNGDLFERDVFHLYAVVIHSGISSESGHYYTCARHPTKISSFSDFDSNSGDEAMEDQQWFMFNDSHVSYCNFKSFGTVTKRFPKDTAYVLFYRKCSSDPAEVQQTDPKSLALKKEVRDMIDKDNVLFLQDKEMDAQLSRCHGVIKPYTWKSDKDDNNPPPGNCGGGFGGISYNRCVY